MRSIYVDLAPVFAAGGAGASFWFCACAIITGSGATFGATAEIPGWGLETAASDEVTIAPGSDAWLRDTAGFGAGDGVSPAITCGAGTSSTTTAAKTAAAENGRSERLAFNGMDSPRMRAMRMRSVCGDWWPSSAIARRI